MKRLTHYLLLCFLISSFQAWAQESPKQACQNAIQLYEKNDISGALAEAKWCVTLLEQQQLEKVKSIFPDEILGFAGADVEHQTALGFSSTKRKYRNNKAMITVTLSDSGGLNQALNAFAAMVEIGGGQKIRIQKRSTTVLDSDSHPRVMVSLNQGGLLMFEAVHLSSDRLIEFARAFPVAQLDESRN